MKLYGYTTVFRYVYENESIENFYYFCTDEYMPSDKEADEIKEDLEIGDNDTFEMFGHTANDFNGDDYLSDRLISALTVEDTPKEYADLQLAYITTQHIDKEDKIGIIKSLIKLYQQKCNFKQFRKMYKVNLYALNRLLYALDEKEEIKSTRRDFVVKQLRGILGCNKDKNNIILQLTEKKNVKIVKSYLDRLDGCYNIKNETSQYRVGILIMLFLNRCKILLPRVQNNLSLGTSLIAEYYNIEAPTYRKDKLDKYIDKNNPSKPLAETIIQEHYEFWEILKTWKD